MPCPYGFLQREHAFAPDPSAPRHQAARASDRFAMVEATIVFSDALLHGAIVDEAMVTERRDLRCELPLEVRRTSAQQRGP
jgi:hypothetical protein